MNAFCYMGEDHYISCLVQSAMSYGITYTRKSISLIKLLHKVNKLQVTVKSKLLRLYV